MLRHDDLDAHFSSALHDSVKIVHLKPQQYAVSVWLIITIANGTVVVLDFEPVQLKHKLAVEDQLLILGAPVTASAAQQALIPSTTCFHIGNGNERLGTHTK